MTTRNENESDLEFTFRACDELGLSVTVRGVGTDRMALVRRPGVGLVFNDSITKFEEWVSTQS